MRIYIIQKIITLLEEIFFYPKLKRFYKNKFNSEKINVIDVGANKGQSIDFFLRLNKLSKIISFEPNKNLYKFLVNKYKNQKNVTLYNFGVSDKDGELTFYENILDETSTFQKININSTYLTKKANILGIEKDEIFIKNYLVPTVKLPSIITDRSLIYDVLKIDVEGHELQVLKGVFEESNNKLNIKFIQLEKHNDDMYLNNDFSEIEKILEQNNFKRVYTIPHIFGKFEEIIFENRNF